MTEKCDVIVVGAGTGGTAAAKRIAKAGLRVALIDSKERKKIGEKVCGDGISKDAFDKLKLKYPQGGELEHKINGFDLYSPDRESHMRIQGEGFTINRLNFGQRLVDDAVDAGATLFDRTIVQAPIIKDDAVCGVTAKKMSTSETVEFLGKITIDASGYYAVLRKALPFAEKYGIETEVEPGDVEICYREIRAVEEELDTPDCCKIYLDQSLAPGGYVWMFPESGKRLNVGLGVQMAKGHPNPKVLLYGHVLKQRIFKDSKLLTGGGGVVPTRRQLWSCVANGFALVGDSACQVNPLHGGGIHSSMLAGDAAGAVTIKAIEKEDYSWRSLWKYNTDFIEVYGYKQPSLDLFRILLQTLTNEELNYGLKNRIVTEEDILKTSMGAELKLNTSEKVRRVFRGIGKISLLKRLNAVAKKMRETKTLYKSYPRNLKELGTWQKKVEAIYDEVKGLSRT
ncbi:MAG: NAD(P)/FAD-dependent oxidoreductase [Promethearchaeati archaeon SRVP18_Atabeyarchaeia-1]